MRLYIYRGFDDEKGLGLGLPRDVTHVIVDDTVSVIKREAFSDCIHLVSVIMGDNVKRIERYAFFRCTALRFVRLSRTLGYIGYKAFSCCKSLEALFLPSTVKSIEGRAFFACGLLVLPHDIDLNNVDGKIIYNVGIHKITGMTPLHMLSMNPHAPADTILTLFEANVNAANVEDNRGRTPLYYALYYNPCAFVRMYSFLREHTIEIDIQSCLWGVQSWRGVDTDPGCTPLHVLVRNPFVPAHVIAALLELKMEDAFCLDIKGLSPLDYAEERMDGLVSTMIAVLCNHRNSIGASKVEVEPWWREHTKVEEHSKKRKEVLCNHRNSIGASKVEVEHTKVEHTKVEEHSKKRKEVKPWWSILIHNCRSLLCIHQCRRKSPLLVNKL
jgi:hypothetical protein